MNELYASAPVYNPPAPASASAPVKHFATRFEQDEVTVSGTVEETAVRGGNLFGREVVVFTLLSTRLSGAVDRIPVCVPLDVAERYNVSLRTDDLVVVSGQLRTYYCETDGHMHALVCASLVATPLEDPQINYVRITGEITKQPVYRVTPFGRQITDASICVFYSDPVYRGVAHVPCVFWGGFANVASTYKPRETISVFGRFQSREYQKQLPDGTMETRIAHEVSVHHCVPIERNFLRSKTSM